MQKNPEVSSCNSTFDMLLGRKCHVLSSRISWLRLLPSIECRYWMSFSRVFSVHLIDLPLVSRTLLAPLLKFLQVRCSTVFSTRGLILWNLTRLLGTQPFGFVRQNSLNMLVSFSSDLDINSTYFHHLPRR